MKILLILLRKEFQQIRRNPAIIRIIFIMPAIQLLILPLAADYEVKNVNLSIVDYDHSAYSSLLINKLMASDYFVVTDQATSYNAALKTIEEDRSDIILTIPQNFEKDFVKESKAKLSLSVNAVNGAKGNIGAAYAVNIINEYNNQIREDWMIFPEFNPVPIIDVEYLNLYNDEMSYTLFMVPGILVILLTMVGSFLTAINIVHEKEVGTIEQINVSPIKKYQFILGKLIPFWVMGFVVLTIGLLISRFVYGIIPAGNLGLIYLFSAVYLFAVLGIGLLISTIAESQQQAMFISFFFLMIFILMGGLYTSIDGMPYWAQIITKFNPVTYFIEVMRMIVMKGSTLRDMQSQFAAMGIMAVVFNGWAVINYSKTR
ncbi:MAG: ABC transporter permease [Bacteroidetes bacterium]|nr:ABC transporter permease [Bacteroidota bacterium]MBK7568217.1 ABC transporter permease [Bacteroidota bacterium]MBP9797005.1 ABC transporter permease [Chitinophagales bacterium]